jgi:hypothetical protein
MRCLILGATILGLTPASAQPSPVAAATPTGYFEAAVVVGIGIGLYTAGAVSGGYHLGHGVWLHGAIQSGSLAGIAFNSQEGSSDVVTSTGHWMARGGVESRSCAPSAAFCSIFGLDAGYLREYEISVANPRNVSAAVIVPRIAFELGGGPLRFRPALEFSFSRNGGETLGISVGAALLF